MSEKMSGPLNEDSPLDPNLVKLKKLIEVWEEYPYEQSQVDGGYVLSVAKFTIDDYRTAFLHLADSTRSGGLHSDALQAVSVLSTDGHAIDGVHLFTHVNDTFQPGLFIGEQLPEDYTFNRCEKDH